MCPAYLKKAQIRIRKPKAFQNLMNLCQHPGSRKREIEQLLAAGLQ